MFEYLFIYLLKSNQEIINLRNEINTLKTELSNIDNSLSLMSLQLRNLSIINHDLNSEKDSAIEISQKCKSITMNQTHSHFKTSKFINDQIPYQCEKNNWRKS